MTERFGPGGFVPGSPGTNPDTNLPGRGPYSRRSLGTMWGTATTWGLTLLFWAWTRSPGSGFNAQGFFRRVPEGIWSISSLVDLHPGVRVKSMSELPRNRALFPESLYPVLARYNLQHRTDVGFDTSSLGMDHVPVKWLGIDFYCLGFISQGDSRTFQRFKPGGFVPGSGLFLALDLIPFSTTPTRSLTLVLSAWTRTPVPKVTGVPCS